MANYSVTRYKTATYNTPDEALDALETQLETVATTKRIYWSKLLQVGSLWQGFAMYAT